MAGSTDFDLIVIGGGPVGLSAAYHAGQRGWRTLVIEQFGYLNDNGSSAGASRQFRVQYSQRYMAELAISAQAYWSALQMWTQETLVGQIGSLWFGDPAISSQEGGIKAAMDTMDTLRVPYTPVDAAEIEQRFRFKNLPSDYRGFFQANGGIINLKASERAMYDVALRSGLVEFLAWESVQGLESRENGAIRVSTNSDDYTATKLAITAGAYVNQILRHFGLKIGIEIWEMSSAYFRKTEAALQYPTWFVFQKPQATSLFYGFPEVDWSYPGYIRVAPDIPDRIIDDPNDRSPAPSRESLSLNSAWVQDHMEGLDPTSQFTSTCLIALATGKSAKELLLDYLPSSVPNNQRIVTYTGGWAAKFIPILGEMICLMLEGEVQCFDFGKFRIDRSNFAIDWLAADSRSN